MSCYCGHRDCPKCSGPVFQSPKKKGKVKNNSQTITEVIARLSLRLDAGDGHAYISRAEHDVIKDFYSKVCDSKSLLEKSETPFYEGMKILNELTT